MALSLGELYVRLSLRNQEFAKSVAASTKTIEAFGRKVSEVGGRLGALGVAGTAALGNFVRVAAQSNRAVAADVKKVENAFAALSQEVAGALRPAVNTLASGIAKLAGFFRSLSPETKELLGSIAAIGTTALVVVGALSKLVGAFTALSPLLPIVLSLAAPFLAVSAGIAGVILLVGALRKAWDADLLGMKSTATSWGDSFRKQISSIGKAVEDKLSGSTWFQNMRRMGAMRGGAHGPADQPGGSNFFEDAAKNIKDTFTTGFETLFGGLIGWVKGQLPQSSAVGLGDPARRIPYGAPLHMQELAGTLAARHQFARGAIASVGRDLGTGGRANRIGTIALEQNAARAAEALKNFKLQAQAARGALANMVMSRTGPIAGLVESGKAGMAAGGPKGAAAAVALDLATQSEAFTKSIAAVSGIVRLLADAMGALLEPLYPLLGAVGVLTKALVDVFLPAMQLIGSVIQPLIPIIVLVGTLLQALAPVLSMLVQAVMIVMNPLLLLAGPVLKGLFVVLKGVAVVALGFAIGIGKVWNGILDAIIWVMKVVDKIPGVDMGGAIRKLNAAKANTDAMEEDLHAIWNMSWEDAQAIAAHEAAVLSNVEAQEKQTETVRKLTEELTNIPSGYKVAVARFAAMASGSTKVSSFIGQYGPKMPKFAAGGIVTKPTVGLIGEGGQSEAIIPLSRLGDMMGRGGGTTVLNVTIQSDNAERIWAELQRLMERDNFRRSGTLVQAGPRLSTARG